MGSSSSKPQAAPVVSSSDNEKSISAMLADVHISPKPKSSNGTLSMSNISSWEDEISSKPNFELARTVLNHTDVRAALLSRKAVVADAHVFNHELKFQPGPVTDQKSSGRCWLFATTNVLRYNVMKRFNLDDFQLSQVRIAALTSAAAWGPCQSCPICLF